MKQISAVLICSSLFLSSCSSIFLEKLELSKPIKNSSYFPEEVDDYYNFSRILYELNEPVFFNNKTGNLEVYRLTSMIEMSGELEVARIIKKDDDIYLVEIIKNLKRNKSSKTKISLKKFKDFKSRLDSFQIHNFKPNISNSADDGIQYSMEIYDGKKYTVIFRNNPQSGKGADPQFLEIAELFSEIKSK